jgi:hypothetical protein
MSSVVKHTTRIPAAGGEAALKAIGIAQRSRALQLHNEFPPRRAQKWWPHTAETIEEVQHRLTLPPLSDAKTATRSGRRCGVTKLLRWLSSIPGNTWQDRWLASGVEERPGKSWADLPVRWLEERGENQSHDRQNLASGLLMLLCLDVIRPGLRWMLTRAHPYLAPTMAQVRDQSGFAMLDELAATEPDSSRGDARIAATRIAMLLASKGGAVADVTVGDCVELIETMRRVHTRGGQKKIDFYLRLRALGIFPDNAPHSIRAFGLATGQLTIEQMVDRYQIQCQPIRDLLVDYLRERQPSLDFGSVNSLSRTLAGLFWARVEAVAPGIHSLHLPADVARAWKDDLRTVKRTTTNGAGERVLATTPRWNLKDELLSVRALYLDIARWAIDDPARWAEWVAPCPISDAEVQMSTDRKHRKARVDQRTRERLPALPLLVRSVNDHRQATANLLATAKATPHGEVIDGTDGKLRRALAPTANGRIVWAQDTATGKRRNLSYEEDVGFWAFATVEVLRLTGVRLEELLELSHHSITEYRLPSTGELVPLLQIAPSKTDVERMLLVSPELADVLSGIVQRSRAADGSIPLVASYDQLEKVWNPPMPLLFQRGIGSERRGITASFIRKLLNNALAATGLTDTVGNPLLFQPHDFRRIFITDAIMNGLPPHIAQVIAGHQSIDTTMGYKAAIPSKPSRRIVRSSRGVVPPARVRSTGLRPKRNGMPSWLTSKSERCRSALAHALSAPRASMNTRASDVRFSDRTRRNAPGLKRSATTSKPASSRQNAKAGWTKSKGCRSATAASRTNWHSSTPRSAAGSQRPNSAYRRSTPSPGGPLPPPDTQVRRGGAWRRAACTSDRFGRVWGSTGAACKPCEGQPRRAVVRGLNCWSFASSAGLGNAY